MLLGRGGSSTVFPPRNHEGLLSGRFSVKFKDETVSPQSVTVSNHFCSLSSYSRDCTERKISSRPAQENIFVLLEAMQSGLYLAIL